MRAVSPLRIEFDAAGGAHDLELESAERADGEIGVDSPSAGWAAELEFLFQKDHAQHFIGCGEAFFNLDDGVLADELHAAPDGRCTQFN